MMRGMAIRNYIEAGVPVLIWGPPGVGKTAHVRWLAKKMGMHLEVVLASIREPADFLGLPVISETGVRFVAPDWAQRLAQLGGILFLDEISTAPPAVQAALLRVVLDRVVGDLPLPSSVRIVAAANPPEWAAGGWELSPPLANRFAHIDWQFDPHEFIREFPSYWGDPPQLDGIDEGEWSKSRSLIAGFLTARPALVLQLPAEESERGKAWASPRSWDMASRLLAVSRLPVQEPEALELIASCVGEGPAKEFWEWASKLDLPNPEEVLADPRGYPLPTRGDQLYAVLTACALHAVQKGDAELWQAALVVMNRAATEQRMPDIAAVALGILARNRPVGCTPDPALMKPFTEFLKGIQL